MLRAVAGDPPGPDLAAVGDELPQQPRVLVVHVGDLLLAEQADLLFWLANRWLGHRGAPWQRPARGGDGGDEGGGVGWMCGVWGRGWVCGAGAPAATRCRTGTASRHPSARWCSCPGTEGWRRGGSWRPPGRSACNAAEDRRQDCRRG